MNKVFENYTNNISLGNIITILAIVGALIIGYFGFRERDSEAIAAIRIEQRVQAAKFEDLYKSFQDTRAEQLAFAVEARHGFTQFATDLKDLEVAIVKATKK